MKLCLCQIRRHSIETSAASAKTNCQSGTTVLDFIRTNGRPASSILLLNRTYQMSSQLKTKRRLPRSCPSRKTSVQYYTHEPVKTLAEPEFQYYFRRFGWWNDGSKSYRFDCIVKYQPYPTRKILQHYLTAIDSCIYDRNVMFQKEPYKFNRP